MNRSAMRADPREGWEMAGWDPGPDDVPYHRGMRPLAWLVLVLVVAVFAPAMVHIVSRVFG